MQHEDQARYKELMAMIATNYEVEFKPPQIKLWWNLFKPYPIETFENAVYQHIQDPDQGMFSPKPANIMKFIKGTEKQIAQSIEDQAELAWHVIEGEIKRVGSWGSLKMEDKQALAAVKAIGGWQKLCSLTTDKMTWAHKEFIAAYKTYSRTPVEALPDKLPGRALLENTKKKGQDQGLKSIAEGFERYQQNFVENNKDQK